MGRHTPVLRPPAVVRLLADPQLPANLWHLLPFTQLNVRLPELGHDLFCTVSLLHEESFPAYGRMDSLIISGSGFSKGVMGGGAVSVCGMVELLSAWVERPCDIVSVEFSFAGTELHLSDETVGLSHVVVDRLSVDGLG